jgi:4-aminobutyrate aminotransferase/(S)-3-amino-2-methylpropionate transaminase
MTSGPHIPQERRIVTAIPGPKSQELLARRTAATSASLGMAIPVFVAKAGGGVIVDVDGNSIIDMAAGIATVNVGNSADRVVKNIMDQIEAFTHTCFTVAPYSGYVEVCEALNRLTPGSFKKKSLLVNSGAEAVENAVKIARAFTKRPAIVVFEHAYHGRTNLTMAMTAKNIPYKEGFGPFAPEIYRMPMAYPYRWIGDKSNIATEALEMVIHKIEKEIGAHNVAAIVIEPIQTGFARTGTMWAVDDENVVPDIMITAKSIAGGLPLGGITGRADVMDTPVVAGLGGTFGGNPIACAAALGAIATIEEDDLVSKAAHMGEIISKALNSMKTKYAIVGDVRGRGAMQALEFVIAGTDEPNSEAMMNVAKYCQQNGVLILTAGTYSNVIRLLPPLVMPDHLLEEALAILDEAVAASV